MFTRGDRVRVVRRCASYSYGWENTWTEEMNAFVGDGKTYVVARVNITGVYFDVDESDNNAPWQGFPPHALELATIELHGPAVQLCLEV